MPVGPLDLRGEKILRLNIRARGCSLVVLTGALMLLSNTSGAQERVAADTAAASARAAIQRLTEAARHADWQKMQPSFPAGSPWERLVEQTVSEQDRRPEMFSFWLRGVGIPEDSLRVRMITPDSAAITTPFTVRGARARWSAVLVRGPRGWVLAQTIESFGESSTVIP